jgi:hypothetical protein
MIHLESRLLAKGLSMNIQLKMRLLLAFSLLMLASCSDGIGTTYPVEGKIMVDGKPLTLGAVAFFPDKSKGNESAHEPNAQIGPKGNYALYTKGKEGAPVGWYKVVVIAEDIPDSTHPTKVKLLVPSKYTRRETTPLEVEVVEYPADNQYDFNLK